MPDPDGPIGPDLLPDEVTVILCPNCLERNAEDRHFCIRCGTPLTAFAAIDPLGRIHATGDTYRKAIASPRKPIIVIGMWLLFGPAAMAFFWGMSELATALIERPSQFGPPMDYFIPMSGLGIFVLEGVLSTMILVRLTRSVATWKRKRNVPPPRAFEVIQPIGQGLEHQTMLPVPAPESSEADDQDSPTGEVPHVADLLIPESVLLSKQPELRRKIDAAQRNDSIDLDSKSYGTSYCHYLVLTHWPELLTDPGDELTDFAIFCNRYYWFLRFSTAYEEQYGKDAGIRQQAFNMLEQGDVEMDWLVINQIEELVETRPLP